MTRYMVTGSTGWFGSWLVPYLEAQGHTVFPESRHRHAPFGKFEYIIHASRAPAADYLKYLEHGGEFLVCSSGAVAHPTKKYAEYIKSKRADELIPGVKIARCYTFISPAMPRLYAAGHFLADNPVRVYGGDNVRSYMHMSDLCEWLYTILHNGSSGIPYNVGSETEITMRQLGKYIAAVRGVSYEEDFAASHDMRHYVPSTVFTRTELGLKQRIPLKEAIHASLDPRNAPSRTTDVQDEGENR